MIGGAKTGSADRLRPAERRGKARSIGAARQGWRVVSDSIARYAGLEKLRQWESGEHEALRPWRALCCAPFHPTDVRDACCPAELRICRGVGMVSWSCEYDRGQCETKECSD